MRRFVVIGSGPAGLMAADRLSAAGHAVTLVEKMPSAGRRLLMAGRGGLNLTHSEPLPRFLARYGAAQEFLSPLIEAFSPADLMAFVEGLGETCFVGSSGRVFPKAMKASPLLRAWLRRLGSRGVELRLSTAWRGWDGAGRVLVETGGRVEAMEADAVLIACGGASWPRLGGGSEALDLVRALGVETRPFTASNVGVRIPWQGDFADRFAGAPLKACRFSVGSATSRAEAVVTRRGLEGGAIYALGGALRQALAEGGVAQLRLDLKPDLALEQVQERLARQPASQSGANRLRKALNLSPLALALMRQGPRERDMALAVKSLSLEITATEGLERAISSAGGVALGALTPTLMLKDRPGVFVAGEMLDFDAPTGGYLLQAAFATGDAAAKGMLAYQTGQTPASA